MNFIDIDYKKEKYNEIYKSLPSEIIENYENDFKVRFTYNSTGIEGNTLTISETKLIIEDKISVGGKELKEIYEIDNNNKAFLYLIKSKNENIKLDENLLKDVHEIVMKNIIQGGIYRNHDVYISGSNHQPPSPANAYYQMKNYFKEIQSQKLHPIELSAYVHAEFTKIHPFVDGNGRTARLLLNYILIINKYPPIIIKKEDRLFYYDCLEEYSVNNNLNPFIEFISNLTEIELDKYLKF
jgi:Fic family protein